MQESKLISELLTKSYVIEALYAELKQIFDYTKLSFGVGFVSSEYYTISDGLTATAYEPNHHYVIEGNMKSREPIIAPYALRVTSMLRPRRLDVENYFKILGAMGCQKIFFQPFLNDFGDGLILFKPTEGGGVIARIGDVKEADLYKIQKEV